MESRISTHVLQQPQHTYHAHGLLGAACLQHTHHAHPHRTQDPWLLQPGCHRWCSRQPRWGGQMGGPHPRATRSKVPCSFRVQGSSLLASLGPVVVGGWDRPIQVNGVSRAIPRRSEEARNTGGRTWGGGGGDWSRWSSGDVVERKERRNKSNRYDGNIAIVCTLVGG